MKNMKKIVAALLVLTMVLAFAGAALAESHLVNRYVYLTKDSNAYTAPKSSKKTESVASKDSVGYCVKVCGDYAKVLVNVADDTYCWFKKCNLKVYKLEGPVLVVWTKGGKGMSTCRKSTIDCDKSVFHGKIKVIAHTNLRKNPGLKFKSQGVVEKCDKLKMTGRYGYDNRGVAWIEVCKDGKKLWVSSMFVELNDAMWAVLYGV